MVKKLGSLFILIFCFTAFTSCLGLNKKQSDSIKEIWKADEKVHSERVSVRIIKSNISEMSNTLVLKYIKKEPISETDIATLKELYKDLSKTEKALKKAEEELEKLIEKTRTP